MSTPAPADARPPSFLESLDTPSDDVRDVLRAIEAFGHTQRCIAAAFAQQLGLPRATLSTLFKLYLHGTMQISELAQLLQVDVSVASRQVTALVEAGLVVRHVDPDDRRARTVALSAAGTERASTARRNVSRNLAAALGGWDRERLTALTTSLTDLSDAVTEHFGGTTHHSKDHA